MTSLRTDAKASKNGRGTPAVARVGAPLPIRQKRPGYAALAVVLIIGLAAVVLNGVPHDDGVAE